MLLIICEINLILTCSANFLISTAAANQTRTCATTDVPIVTLTSQDNTKILQQLKLGFKNSN